MQLEHQKFDSLDKSSPAGGSCTEQPSAGQLAAGAAGHLKLLIELLDTINDRIFLIDNQERITFVNEAFLDAYGLTSTEVLGKSPEEVLPAEILSACQEADQGTFGQGDPVRLEMNWQDPKTGARCWTETHKYPMRDATGKITGVVGISRDITASRKAKEELKRSESLLLHASRLSSMGELAAGIAHEVNQPLFSILNYAKAIENKLQDKESLDLGAISKWIEQIKREAARGGQITQRLKSFVKPAETQRKLSAINKIVLESIEFMAREAREANVKIETKLAKNLPDLLVDQIQIQQVLVNLLKNAIEACVGSDTASPKVVVSTHCVSTGIEITVADNGPGVSGTDDINILDPFQTTKHEGIGLGLAISKTIIEAHQGQLSFHPNDEGGATFCFALPAAYGT